mgnify:CR=1 FL=1
MTFAQDFYIPLLCRADRFCKTGLFFRKTSVDEKARPPIFLLTDMCVFSQWRLQRQAEVFVKIEQNRSISICF